MAAALLMGAACLLSLFSDHPVTGYYLLILPVAVWEMVVAAWLLVKGFSPAIGETDITIGSVATTRRAAGEPV
jgi:hypothetical protein